MLAAAALRLSAVEALCPTAAMLAGSGFPTMAGRNVYDSRQITVDELTVDAAWTPSLGVFTEDIQIERRGDAAGSAIGNPTVDLVITVELARHSSVQGEEAVQIVEDGDPKANLVLDALTAQVRKTLVYAPRGTAFRRIMSSVRSVTIQSAGLPQYGIRLMCRIMTFSCVVGDDKYTDEAGLPEPMKSLFDGLPDGSYAKAKLTELGEAFLAPARTPLAGLNLHPTTGDGAPAITPPAP